MALQLYGMAIVAVVLAALYLFQHVRSLQGLPTAPGYSLARRSHMWYLWKVWQGHFETYNIQAHRSEGLTPLLRGTSAATVNIVYCRPYRPCSSSHV